jgi:hypothetical protein
MKLEDTVWYPIKSEATAKYSSKHQCSIEQSNQHLNYGSMAAQLLGCTASSTACCSAKGCCCCCKADSKAFVGRLVEVQSFILSATSAAKSPKPVLLLRCARHLSRECPVKRRSAGRVDLTSQELGRGLSLAPILL